MTVLLEYMENNGSMILLILAVCFVILAGLLAVTYVSLRKQRNRYYELTRDLEGVSFEDLIIQLNRDISNLNRDVNLIESNILSIETKLTFALQKIGFIRYNAFEDIGSDLSFSIALLDAYNNGFVITSMYGREKSVSFAKQVKNGKSSIPISPEERMAIERAVRGEKPLDSFSRGGENVQISLFS
ncbi:DUF4446 family protein [Gudongella oleilytica]|jgi:hypothetical protein|uniref:DUF4446 family protein n=1 Tax=Gudongella oleilytica TaxID=1582259 RepID=UPI000FF8A7C3|nr:DUF4446 family protein [Gudongella oleilytica]